MTYEEYFQSLEFKEILGEYEYCVLQGKSCCVISSDDYADIAQYYHETGFDDKADLAVEQGLAIYPNALALITIKTRQILMDEESAEEAWELVGQVEDKYTGEYHHLVAEIMIAERRYDEADLYLEEWLQNWQTEDEQENFSCNSAWLFYDFRQYALARKWLNRCREREEEDYLELHGLLLTAEQKYKESQTVFNQLIDRNPFSVRYWNLLAYAQMRNGEVHECLTSYEYALAIAPNNTDTLYHKARVLLTMRNFAESLELLKRYNSLCPDDYSCLFLQGICLEKMEQNEDALELFDKSLALMDETDGQDKETRFDEIEVYKEKIYVLTKMGRYHDALDCLDLFDEEDIDIVTLEKTRGTLYLVEKRVEEAKQCFDKAIALSDNDPQIILQVAIYLCEERCFKDCYNYMLMLDSKDIEVMGAKGCAYLAVAAYHLKMPTECAQLLEMAEMMNPGIVQLLCHETFPDNMEKAVGKTDNLFMSDDFTLDFIND